MKPRRILFYSKTQNKGTTILDFSGNAKRQPSSLPIEQEQSPRDNEARNIQSADVIKALRVIPDCCVRKCLPITQIRSRPRLINMQKCVSLAVSSFASLRETLDRHVKLIERPIGKAASSRCQSIETRWRESPLNGTTGVHVYRRRRPSFLKISRIPERIGDVWP